MIRPPLAFRIRVAVLAIVAIAWLATRDAPSDGDVQPGAASPASSQVVVAGKAGNADGR